jgi:phosphoribosyl 1,2-cyclic phosphate phosphodiesterase
MKAIVLGSGSAYSVPNVGGFWGDCDPKNPKNRRTAPSVLIEEGEVRILIDLGPDYREQSEKHNLTFVDAIIYTHGHSDHILGNFHLPRMMRYYDGRELPMYATRETREQIERMFWFQYNNEGKTQYSGKTRPHWVDIKANSEFYIGGIKFLPMLQRHGSMDTLGFRIGDFAYSTDFNEMPESTFMQLQGLDTWLVECNAVGQVTEPEEKHLHLQKVLRLIDRVKPKKAYLTHLNATIDYDTISARLPPNVHLAYDGLELQI